MCETQTRKSVLHTALIAKQIEVAKLLVSHGASIHVADRAGRLPLHVAARAGCADGCAHLIACGADINVQCLSGYTPLMYAAEYNRGHVARILIDRGCATDLENNIGYTATALAEWQGMKKIVAMIKNGVVGTAPSATDDAEIIDAGRDTAAMQISPSASPPRLGNSTGKLNNRRRQSQRRKNKLMSSKNSSKGQVNIVAKAEEVSPNGLGNIAAQM